MTRVISQPPGGDDDIGPFLDRAAEWAVDLSYRDVPRSVRRTATAGLSSAVGAALWTLTHPLGEEIVAATRSIYRKEEKSPATFLAGGTLPPAGAAYGHAALSAALNYDDAVLGGPTGHSAVFVPLAYAETAGVDGRRTLLAQVAATEVAARLGAAATGGWEEATYVHAVAAAVGRAVIDGDDAETLSDALGIALGGPPWPLESATLGSDAYCWRASEPLSTGLAALEAARAGQSGRRSVVEDSGGFLAAFADYPISSFLEGFGTRWHTQSLSVKGFPADRAVVPAIEAALQARGRLDPGRTALRRVDVDASAFTIAANARVGAYLDADSTPVSALTASVPHAVAAALADGEYTPRALSGTPEEATGRLADRVFLRHDPGLTRAALRSELPVGLALEQLGPRAVGVLAGTLGVGTTLRAVPTSLRFLRRRPIPDDLDGTEQRLGARVVATTAGGRTVEATTERPSGFAGAPPAERRALARRKPLEALEAHGVDTARARQRTERLFPLERPGALSDLVVE